MKLVLNERGCELHHAEWQTLALIAAARGGVDAVIVDAPYSARTHAGHDDGTADANRKGAHTSPSSAPRRSIAYAPWHASDVDAFVSAWSPLCRGWFASITDHTLAPAWCAALEREGRYVFAPLPYVHVGGRVRLVGDGPSTWTCWLVVARPRNRAFASWGTLPGAYVLRGGCERMAVVGGKTEWLMRALVRDYTRPGDLVADPCCGGGTLGVACIAEGRRALLGDRDAAHVAIAAERLRSLPMAPSKGGTLSLFAKAAT